MDRMEEMMIALKRKGAG